MNDNTLVTDFIFAMATLEDKTDVEEKEYGIAHFKYPNNRKIKKIPTSHIYKQSLFSQLNFLKPYEIMRVEENVVLRKYEDVYLLSRDDIRKYRSKYQFLHIGLVQFSIVNLQIFKSNVSVSLRDSKYPNLQDSILVSFDSDVNQYQEAVKFNWFPNFSASLSDLANSNGLVVTIDPSHSIVHLCVRYKICYKLMKTSLKPDYLFENPVLEVNTEKANVVVPKCDN
ncbi:hypothetical protein QL285_085540 [Trifolium repens]|nr:hypothetical protein QL285_085540 [Trifolium repens]